MKSIGCVYMIVYMIASPHPPLVTLFIN